MYTNKGIRKTESLFEHFSLLDCRKIAGDVIPGFSVDKFSILPGLCDVHVHFREPGFSYKETILSGSRSAAAGGYTAVCTMPNLNPVPDSIDNINKEIDIIKRDAVINVYPYASITVGELGETLSDFDGMKDLCIAYSDDGKGVQNEDTMRKAMLKARELNKIIVAHCEVNELLCGGYIHKGDYAEKHGHRGICSESEYKQVERDLSLAEEIGCKYHVCHISTKESVDLVRQAKKRGIDVTCETAPHYLVLDENDILEDGRFKMNPPLRSGADKKALIDGIIDGTIDMIATDHAPHSAEEKSRGLEKSAFGIVGLETAVQIMYTHLVKKGIIDFEKLMDLMVINPRKRFNIPLNTDFSVWNFEKEITVNSDNFLSKGRATPFDKSNLYGECLLTVCNGKVVYKKF